jgi:hypothetical protein
MKVLHALAVVSVTVSSAIAQAPQQPGARRPAAPARQGPPPLGPSGTRDPFPNPIPAEEGAIKVDFVEFAVLPDVEGNAARPMLMSYEPGTRRLFVNDMHGALYAASTDGKTVTSYLDHRDPRWEHRRPVSEFRTRVPEFRVSSAVQPARRARLREDLHLHRHDQRDADSRLDACSRHKGVASFRSSGVDGENPGSRHYDGEAPRELMRWQRPYVNHNGGQMGFNPTARPGSADYGLLYQGNADGGSGGDPMNVAQNLASSFGKILRIDPLGNNSANGKYGIPERQSVRQRQRPEHARRDLRVRRTQPATLRLGLEDRHDVHGRHRSRDCRRGDDGTKGANLGWRIWEGSSASKPAPK